MPLNGRHHGYSLCSAVFLHFNSQNGLTEEGELLMLCPINPITVSARQSTPTPQTTHINNKVSFVITSRTGFFKQSTLTGGFATERGRIYYKQVKKPKKCRKSKQDNTPTGLPHEEKSLWKSTIKHRTGKSSLCIKSNLYAPSPLPSFFVYSVSGERNRGLTELKVLLEQICFKQASHQQKQIKERSQIS